MRRRLEPINDRPPLDAYEREFGPIEPAPQPTRDTRIYCGAKPNPPDNRPRGSPNACFKKGIAVGRNIGTTQGIQTGVARQRQFQRVMRDLEQGNRNDDIVLQRERMALARVAGETAAVARERQSIKQRIRREGLAALKSSISLNQLNKDELRSIIIREREKNAGFRADSSGYSNMSMAQLAALLRRIGYN